MGLIMRERKSPLGAPPAVEVRDSGRFGAVVLGTSDARGALVAVGPVFGLVVVEGFRASFSSSCLAADAAVGAVRREGRPTGRVGDRGFGFLKPTGEMLVFC